MHFLAKNIINIIFKTKNLDVCQYVYTYVNHGVSLLENKNQIISNKLYLQRVYHLAL